MIHVLVDQEWNIKNVVVHKKYSPYKNIKFIKNIIYLISFDPMKKYVLLIACLFTVVVLSGCGAAKPIVSEASCTGSAATGADAPVTCKIPLEK